MKRYLGLLLLLAVAAQSAATDGTAILGASVSVEAVHLSAARAGESSHLQFRIRNDSRERLVLLRVESAVSSAGRIEARVGASEWADIGSIAIPADSTLDVGSTHLRIVIERVESELRADASVPVRLQFNRGFLTLSAHVTGP